MRSNGFGSEISDWEGILEKNVEERECRDIFNRSESNRQVMKDTGMRWRRWLRTGMCWGLLKTNFKIHKWRKEKWYILSKKYRYRVSKKISLQCCEKCYDCINLHKRNCFRSSLDQVFFRHPICTISVWQLIFQGSFEVEKF